MCQGFLTLTLLTTLCEHKKKILYDAYVSTLIVEEIFLRQKSRVQWLRAGDKNSSFFFQSISKNRSSNRLVTITRVDGSIVNSEEEVKWEAINFFQSLVSLLICHCYGDVVPLY